MSGISSAWATVLVFALGAIFNAGVTYGLNKALRRDVNGIGRKQREAEAASAQQRLSMAVFLMLICPESSKEEIASMLICGKK